MKVALYNLEPYIVNAAMMKVSKYHKDRGDEVCMYHALWHDTYDKIYAFSIFDFTPKSYVRKNMICGGTGFDLTTLLPPEIEKCDYDWSLYSKCDHSLVWFSKGCIRNCGFCVVHQKEGMIKPVGLKNRNPNGKYIKVMDNNFFANPKWKEAIAQLQEWGQPVDFQGVDARILTKEMCEALNSLKHRKQIHIAWDNPKYNLVPKLREIIRYIKPYKLMCYVLIGYDSTEREDIYRSEELRELKIDPFAMPYDKNNDYQRDFTRWMNCKQIWRRSPWGTYDRSI